jgi:RNA polymerase sigma-70 factor (ECF subfamily)
MTKRPVATREQGESRADETEVTAAVREVFARAWGRLLALLAGQLRSLDIAEESLADAFEQAVCTWTDTGVPDRPEAWLLTTARRRGLDRLRRETTFTRKLPLLVVDTDPVPAPEEEVLADAEDAAIPDERLRLIFVCCHPALAMEARIALTLRLVGGLTTAEIARAFLTSEATMAARLTRAKKKIAAAKIPYRVPGDDELLERLDGVLAVLYLIFTEGHAASSGEVVLRSSLCEEAIRLTRVVVSLLPDQPDPSALLALMLFQHSRRDARVDQHGQPVLLADQDRTRWHASEIAEGLSHLRRAMSFGRETAYLLQAAIAAEHAVSPSTDQTDWTAIAALYARLEALTGSPVVRLNRAVAVAEAEGPAAALGLLEGLDADLPRYYLLPAVRASLLSRLGRYDAAREEYRRAIASTDNVVQRTFFAQQMSALESRTPPRPG